MEPVVGGTKGRDSRMERGHRRDVPGLDGETKVHARARERKRERKRKKTSLHGGWRGKGMNGDCRPRGRDEWSGTRGGNGGETRARRTFRERKLNEEGRKGRKGEGCFA